MGSKKKKGLEILFKYEMEYIDIIIKTLLNLYDKGVFFMEFTPVSTEMVFPEVELEKLSKKLDLAKDELKDIISGITRCIFHILRDDEKDTLERYSGKENVILSKIFNKLKKELNNHPTIKERFRFKSLCKMKYLKDIDWEVNIKVYQENEENIGYPFAIIKMFLDEIKIPPNPYSEPQTIMFECSAYEVETIIKKLKDVKKMLEKAKKIKLEEGEKK